MSQWILEFFRDHGTTIRAVVALTLVASVCSVVGCFIILRRMAFLADALAHSMLAGVVVGYLTMKIAFGIEASAPGMIVGALIAGMLTAALIGFVTKVSRVKQDTAIGIMYTGIFALGGFLATYKPLASQVHVDLYHFVVGNVLSVTDTDMWTLTVVVILVMGAVLFFYRQLKLVAFDPVMAAAIGIPVLMVDYLLTGCASLVVVWGVGIVGVVLVVALIVTPAATAYLIHDRLDRMISTSVIVSVISSWMGYALATWTEVAPGPAIVLVGTLVFLATLIVSPKYGVIAIRWQRMSRVPQSLLEDTLLQFHRTRRPQVQQAELVRQVPGKASVVKRCIESLIQSGWLERVSPQELKLTTSGEAEAARLVRAHRLWEAYLEKVGLDPERLHPTADRLEHVHDEATVGYLDDKLGHPLTDPHGSEIPIAPGSHAIGRLMPASELRAGFEAEVEAWSGETESPVAVGTRIRSLPRRDDGQTWVFEASDGELIACDHETADHLRVRIVKDVSDGNEQDRRS